jgi:dipeptidase E
MRVLLVSNSGRPFLAHCMAHVREFLGSVPRLAFVSAATLHDETAYHLRVWAALGAPPPDGVGIQVLHLRWNADPLATLARADALFVGGGNTYALLDRLREAKLLDPIRERIRAGMPYMGVSAGANVAGPNILTTNDWNVVGLGAFEALGLVPFNINPHFLESDPTQASGGETREERIREFHTVWPQPVLGLEEGALVRVDDDVATILGAHRVKVFQRGREPRWLGPRDRFALSSLQPGAV